jgi:hypothetical protein
MGGILSNSLHLRRLISGKSQYPVPPCQHLISSLLVTTIFCSMRIYYILAMLKGRLNELLNSLVVIFYEIQSGTR